MRDLRSGRALLLLDLSNEGHALLPALFDQLHAYVDRWGIPRSNVVFVSQNRLLESQYREVYGEGQDALRFGVFDYFIKRMAAEAETWSDGAPDGSNDGNADRPDRTLLCLNATPRPHRVLTLAGLHHYELLEDALVSFPGLRYPKASMESSQMLEYLSSFPELETWRGSLEYVCRMEPRFVDSFSETGNDLWNRIDPTPYARTHFSLVTETEFTDGSVHRITEKTVKALAMGHPVVIVGNPHSVALFKSLGFESCPGVIDDHYDDLADPQARLSVLFEQVRQAVRAVQTDPSAWSNRVDAVCRRNRQHARHGLKRQYSETVERKLEQELLAYLE